MRVSLASLALTVTVSSTAYSEESTSGREFLWDKTIDDLIERASYYLSLGHIDHTNLRLNPSEFSHCLTTAIILLQILLLLVLFIDRRVDYS